MKSPAQTGYTLIEILVVMVIMGILFTAGYVNLRDYARAQTLTAVARSLVTDLHSAEENANAGDKPSGCNGVLNGYQFNVISSTTYELDAFCTGGNVQVKPVILPADLTISAPVPNPVVFKSIAEGTNIASGATATIIITQTSTKNTRTITIGANGSIQ